LLAGELPLTLAYLFGELCNCRTLAQAGRQTLARGFDELLDAGGVPRASHLPGLRPLVACWTRCRAICQGLDNVGRPLPFPRQFPALVQTALRFSRAGGQPTFAAPNARGWEPRFTRALVRLAGNDAKRIARLTTRGRATGRPAKGLPPTSLESETAAVALLRSDWTRSSPQLAVAYAGPRVEFELNLGANCLCSGGWTIEVRSNDERLAPRGDWQQTCWVSDDEVDYLELSLELSGEVTVERHILLARKDRVLLLADAVLGIQESSLEYRGGVSLGRFSRFAGQDESREGLLAVGGRPLARVLPLALPEWRAQRAAGDLRQIGDALELVQTAGGACLFAPLLVDMNAARIRRETTWRQLTVAENRQNVPADVAVGYRAQAGRAQWLVYRSLAPPAIRSVLGKSLMHQFLFGNFPQSGRVETLLEIDST
jgi:hypothetical protein